MVGYLGLGIFQLTYIDPISLTFDENFNFLIPITLI